MNLDTMLARKRDFSVLWLKFIQKFQQDPNKEIWVFEGKDDIDYYSTRIEAYFGEAPRLNVLIAEGKQNSLRLKTSAAADAELAKSRLVFFVDSDFDAQGTLADRQTYVTPCYSIENLYFSLEAVDKFLTDRLQLFEADDRREIAQILEGVRTWRDNAVSALLPYCALLALAKPLGDESRVLSTFLKEKFFSEVVALRRTGSSIEVTSILTASQVRDAMLNDPATEDAKMLAKIEQWRQVWGAELFRAVRGKYLFPILAQALALLLEDSTRRRGRALFSKRRPCSHQIREDELIAALSRFADTPPCLISFLMGLSQSWRPETANAPLIAT